ncbi:hypothetical protein MU780_23705, partial [Salmonella enterica subsp. enterica serovar Enteritidis]|nr:hypothetical protein [Salmonella enterica subsp. enterica serovar Enteritidis]MCL9344697.1 hypothetical protein [Salmonella enterica subsp. enterica serovar Enteritidis]MCL9358513.1 hypothetical protein [Salmonella enterica subsp. enterica serovar Enteritidis]MCL9358551.1 hypothetical protein [Salmonella enterica subsp. enterica serovar Enteritidis]
MAIQSKFAIAVYLGD